MLWLDSCFGFLSYLQIIKIDSGNQDVIEQRKATTSLPTPFYFIGSTPPDRRRNVLNPVLKTYKPYILFPLITGGVAATQNQPRNTNINSADGVVVFCSSVSSTTSPSVSCLNRIHSSLVRRRNFFFQFDFLDYKIKSPHEVSPPHRRGAPDCKRQGWGGEFTKIH